MMMWRMREKHQGWPTGFWVDEGALNSGIEFLVTPGVLCNASVPFSWGFLFLEQFLHLIPSHSSFKSQLGITSLGCKLLLCVYISPCEYTYCTALQLSVYLPASFTIKNILRKWWFIWKELILTLSYNQDFSNPVTDYYNVFSIIFMKSTLI